MHRYLVSAFLSFALFVIAAAVAATPAWAAKRIALIIGNSSYTNISALDNPDNDAELMGNTLRELGFEVTVKIDANRRDMARAIRDFGRQLTGAGRESVGLFFYAGHGVQANGTNYLLPLGAEIVSEPDLEIEAVNANWVLRQMENAGNGLNIVILDACRNNPFAGSFRSGGRGLARIERAPSGSLIAYSAAPGQVASDGRGENSPYTTALASAIRQPGVELLSVFRQVRVEVEEQTGGEQTPWEHQSVRGEFFFAEPTVAPTEAVIQQPAVTTTPSLPVPEPTRGNAAEIAFWNTVKDSRNPSELQAYLDVYPNGMFKALAQIRIAALNAEANSMPQPQPQPEPERDTTVATNNAYGGSSSGSSSSSGTSSGGAIQGQALPGSSDTVAALPNQQSPDDEAERMFQTGEQYYYGNGVQQDYAEAVQWYRRATEFNHAESLFSLGWVYAEGQGVQQDYTEAARWYRRAANIGHAASQLNLAYMYDVGRGVAQNDGEALVLYRQAAAQGNAQAMNNLAILYDEGRGTNRNPGEAARYLLEAYVLGNESSESWLFEKSNQWADQTRREVQRILQAAGYYTGPIDGGIGPATKSALRAYRQARGN